ncbi:MAG: hypothetical protein IJ329_04190 [Clostridia bacterium]|nr:hypothetical protein [Clostridia bacterium]
MKKRSIRSSIFAGIASLLFSFSALQTSTLTDITKPYLGEYECITAEYGKKNLLSDFSDIVLDLRKDNTFVLRYEDKHGEKHEESGTYEYDTKKDTFRFTFNGKAEIKRDFPLEKGEISVVLKLGWRTLSLRFQQK